VTRTTIGPGVGALIGRQWQFRRILFASARVELRKRYAGSLLGPLWTVLYPLMFLGVYLFIWLVVFPVRFPGLSGTDYVLFVFGGLIPYLFLVESATAGCVSIKQNLHVIKNVILPIELVPTRTVIVALAGHLVGVGLLVVLSIISHNATWRLVTLPLVVTLQVLWLIGLVWLVAPLGVIVPDIAIIVSLGLMMLMFVSPIAFKVEMVPASYRALVSGNPVTYMADAYRAAIMRDVQVPIWRLAIFAGLSLGTFLVGATACWRFKDFVVDAE
jgi:lipopolysaccharide transport system permease protein